MKNEEKKATKEQGTQLTDEQMKQVSGGLIPPQEEYDGVNTAHKTLICRGCGAYVTDQIYCPHCGARVQ